MRILYADLICPLGHVFYNNIQIASISSRYDVDFVFQKGYAGNLNIPDGSTVFEYHAFADKKNVVINAISYRLYMISYQNYVSKVAREGNYDIIFISSFETLSFCVSLPYKTRVIAICHNNIDYIKTSRVKRVLFQRTSKEVYFVVLNKASDSYFNSIKVRHFLAGHGTILLEKNEICQNIIFMPVNDCPDLEVLNYLQGEDFLNFLSKSDLRICIKEKYIKVDHPNIIKLKNYLPQTEYDSLMSTSMAVLLPYDENRYMYRSSGLFYEAVGKRKNIIAPSCPNFEADVCDGDRGIYLYSKPSQVISIIETIKECGVVAFYDNLLAKTNEDIIEKIIMS